MIKLSLDELKTVSAKRLPGYYDEVIGSGHVEGDVLFLDDKVYVALRGKYSARLPALTTQAKNIIGAARKALVNRKPVSKEERERRLAICKACEFLKDGKRCLKCGCHVNWKSRLEAWHCPIDKW